VLASEQGCCFNNSTFRPNNNSHRPNPNGACTTASMTCPGPRARHRHGVDRARQALADGCNRIDTRFLGYPLARERLRGDLAGSTPTRTAERWCRSGSGWKMKAA
jgi:hypothetical protein